MSFMSDKVSAEAYLVLVPDIRGKYVYGIRVDRVRSNKPSLNSGEIAVKIKLNFNKQALIDSIPVLDLDVSSFITAPARPEPESVEIT